MTRKTPYNSRFAKAGVSYFYESEVLNSSFVHLMKFSASKTATFAKPRNVSHNLVKKHMNQTIYQDGSKNAIRFSQFSKMEAETPFTGLGLYGKVEVWQGILLAFLIYALQVIFSRIWLSYFYFGPLEWLWRSLTYRKFQEMKRKKQTA
jgi:hypothetical protein